MLKVRYDLSFWMAYSLDSAMTQWVNNPLINTVVIFLLFQEHVHTLKASGNTKLYDALQLGMLELGKVKKKFPDCKIRILCLTDGDDVG